MRNMCLHVICDGRGSCEAARIRVCNCIETKAEQKLMRLTSRDCFGHVTD